MKIVLEKRMDFSELREAKDLHLFDGSGPAKQNFILEVCEIYLQKLAIQIGKVLPRIILNRIPCI